MALAKGDQVQYNKQIMFKGSEKVVATVVAIVGNKVLLDNGDTFHTFQIQ